MASEQTVQTQPPTSLAPSDLTASQWEDEVEKEPAHWTDTLLWPSRRAGGHKGTQRHAERLRAIQSDAEGCRHKQKEASAHRKQTQHGLASTEKGHSMQCDMCSCPWPKLAPSAWWKIKPWQRAGRGCCTGEMVTCSARRKPLFTNPCRH